jgi:hypothetical protein
MADAKTEELRLEQIQRERAEREQARDAPEPAEERTHRRRADRATYLKSKLDERARSEEGESPGGDSLASSLRERRGEVADE